MNIRNVMDNSNLTRGAGAIADISAVSPAASPGGVLSGGQVSGQVAGDQARVSNAASQMSESALGSALGSDIRMSKVISVQGALAAGTYQVPAVEVANKVIQSMLPPE
uniref:Anti-sigma-28 factor FlgM C-terminal domain-containing protein n=1 Tax=mine drainage metagenome TaxID=410659 RepID=E6PZE4_9ZZZZ